MIFSISPFYLLIYAFCLHYFFLLFCICSCLFNLFLLWFQLLAVIFVSNSFSMLISLYLYPCQYQLVICLLFFWLSGRMCFESFPWFVPPPLDLHFCSCYCSWCCDIASVITILFCVSYPCPSISLLMLLLWEVWK